MMMGALGDRGGSGVVVGSSPLLEGMLSNEEKDDMVGEEVVGMRTASRADES